MRSSRSCPCKSRFRPYRCPSIQAIGVSTDSKRAGHEDQVTKIGGTLWDKRHATLLISRNSTGASCSAGASSRRPCSSLITPLTCNSGFHESVLATLPLSEWGDTCDTLHLWTQIAGKFRLALTPLVNHWWNVPLYVTSRGLTTRQYLTVRAHSRSCSTSSSIGCASRPATARRTLPLRPHLGG